MTLLMHDSISEKAGRRLRKKIIRRNWKTWFGDDEPFYDINAIIFMTSIGPATHKI